MKIDKEKLRALTALEDKELWKVITDTLQKYGYTPPEKAPSEENMKKIRSVMKDTEKISTRDVLRLMSEFKVKRNKE